VKDLADSGRMRNSPYYNPFYLMGGGPGKIRSNPGLDKVEKKEPGACGGRIGG